ncbi:hypothetical protein [Hoeflea sp.]|uniref:hypothetical protein n=1 Tax=Hoeflea sp. TaxID=1940281 RepID=UPI00374798F1
MRHDIAAETRILDGIAPRRPDRSDWRAFCGMNDGSVLAERHFEAHTGLDVVALPSVQMHQDSAAEFRWRAALLGLPLHFTAPVQNAMFEIHITAMGLAFQRSDRIAPLRVPV